MSATPPSDPAPSARRHWIALALLAAGFWVSSWTASRHLPALADEIAHVAGGESYWRFGINHLQPENGYIAMHWATLPLRLHPPAFPALPDDLPRSATMIVMGNRLFYELGNDPAVMLARGRAMMALIGAGLVLLIGAWGRRLWGAGGGLLAAGLASFCPTLLAHAGLVMSDATLAFFLLLTVTLWWRVLHRFSIGSILGCGVSLGLLLLSKMSGVLAAPMLIALAALRLCEPRPIAAPFPGLSAPATGARKFAPILVAGLAVAAVAIFVLWAAFGFRFSMFANPGFPRPQHDVAWHVLSPDDGAVKHGAAWLNRWRLLPEGWLHGLALTTQTLGGRHSFLNGETTLGGTFWYFPYAWLVKTPLALFGLMALGLAAVFTPRTAAAAAPRTQPLPAVRDLLWTGAPLLVLFVVYWAFALTTPINIGHRHLIPIYAPALVLAGGAATLLSHRAWPVRLLVLGLAGWFAAASLSVRPRYLSYFNTIAGGPENGYRHLVDSNVDVGQDLIALKIWLDATPREKATPVFLAYFGPADPVAHGLRATRFADHGFDARPRTLPAPIGGGLFCISVTLFQGLYGLAPGPWTSEREASYRRLLEIATSRPPNPGEATTLEHLQFARLRHALAARKPDARIGHSILVFRLGDQEVAEALYAPTPRLSPAPPRASP